MHVCSGFALVGAVLLSACFPSLPAEPDGATLDGDDGTETAVDDGEGREDVMVVGETATWPPLQVPMDFLASTNLEDHVALSWAPVTGADGYEVLRNGAAVALIDGAMSSRYEDRWSVLAVRSDWTAPLTLAASNDDPTGINLSWAVPERPVGQAARYSVRAFNSDGPGPQTTEAVGQRAAPALSGWEIEVSTGSDTGVWVATGSSLPSWRDTNAPVAEVDVKQPTASQGRFRGFVKLSALETTLREVAVSYRVRGRLETGGTTPPSTKVMGFRRGSIESEEWEAGATPDGPFTALRAQLDNHTAPEDSDAPSDGSSRYYRRRVTLLDGRTIFSVLAEGWRLAFIDVSVAVFFACAITSDGTTWCWGQNRNGELGRGYTSDFEVTPSPASFTGAGSQLITGPSGFGHGFACNLVNDDVECFGVGQHRNDEPPSIPQVLRVPDVSTIAAGFGLACTLLGSGESKCWGLPYGGQLGPGVTIGSRTPLPVLRRSQFSNTTVPLTGIVEVRLGGGFGGCARLGNRSVWCWPDENHLASENPNLHGALSLWRGGGGAQFHRCVITSAGGVACWGEGSMGQLGHGELATSQTPVAVTGLSDSPATTVAMGSGHSCATQYSGAVRCWGDGTYGQLGHGQSGSNVMALTPVQVPEANGATMVSAGLESTCAIIDSDVYCWSRNDFGQLGLGDIVLRNKPTRIVTP